MPGHPPRTDAQVTGCARSFGHPQGGGALVFRSVRLCFPAEQVVEVAAVVRAVDRVRAVDEWRYMRPRKSAR